MPGLGTFNLTAFWRAMGIKNPHPTMFETIQPVINVGDMAGLTPQHVPPTDWFGGDVAAVAAEFSLIQVTARAAGGCLIPVANIGTQIPNFGIVPRVPGLTPLAGVGPFSNEPLVSLVEIGTRTPNPLTVGISPHILTSNISVFPATVPFYVPPGQSMIFIRDVVNGSILNWTMCVVDVPASEPPPD